MTKCVKIKCDDCKFVEDCVDYGWLGCKKFTPAPSEPMTNEEWLCELSTEAKAGWLGSVVKCNSCPADKGVCERAFYNCKRNLIDWLKAVHKE